MERQEAEPHKRRKTGPMEEESIRLSRLRYERVLIGRAAQSSTSAVVKVLPGDEVTCGLRKGRHSFPCDDGDSLVNGSQKDVLIFRFPGKMRTILHKNNSDDNNNHKSLINGH